jgi:hypothetical protein
MTQDVNIEDRPYAANQGAITNVLNEKNTQPAPSDAFNLAPTESCQGNRDKSSDRPTIFTSLASQNRRH